MATTALCAEKTVSASLIYPVVDGLLKHHLKVKEDDLDAVIAFKEVVSQEMVRQFQFDKDNVAVLAAAVDPRHSHLTCPTEQSQVQDILREKVQHMISASKPMEGKKEAPPRKKRKETAMSFLLGIALMLTQPGKLIVSSGNHSCSQMMMLWSGGAKMNVASQW